VAAIKIARALYVTVEYLAFGQNAGTAKPNKKHGRDTLELIKWVENLNLEQSKAILKLVKTFKNQTSAKN